MATTRSASDTLTTDEEGRPVPVRSYAAHVRQLRAGRADLKAVGARSSLLALALRASLLCCGDLSQSTGEVPLARCPPLALRGDLEARQGRWGARGVPRAKGREGRTGGLAAQWQCKHGLKLIDDMIPVVTRKPPEHAHGFTVACTSNQPGGPAAANRVKIHRASPAPAQRMQKCAHHSCGIYANVTHPMWHPGVAPRCGPPYVAESDSDSSAT